MGYNPVLDTTRPIVEDAQDVSIDGTALERLAQSMGGMELSPPSMDEPIYPKGIGDDVIDFFMLGNSINFAFTDFSTGEKFATTYAGADWRGSLAMWACLKRGVDNGIIDHHGGNLQRIGYRELEFVFMGNRQIPMLQERLDIFHEVGAVLSEKYEGYFHNLALGCGGRLFDGGRGLVERLTADFPSFDDSCIYEGRKVRFDKRAQLLAVDIQSRFHQHGITFFEDMDDLTMFADYSVPNTLRRGCFGLFIQARGCCRRQDPDPKRSPVGARDTRLYHSCVGEAARSYWGNPRGRDFHRRGGQLPMAQEEQVPPAPPYPDDFLLIERIIKHHRLSCLWGGTAWQKKE